MKMITRTNAICYSKSLTGRSYWLWTSPNSFSWFGYDLDHCSWPNSFSWSSGDNWSNFWSTGDNWLLSWSESWTNNCIISEKTIM